MSHEPTREEWLLALAAYSEHKRTSAGMPISAAIAAANRIRDARIRAEALEEAVQMLFDDIERTDMHIAQVLRAYVSAIRALKDKTDD
jgi:hypothetical protein